jgi:hypothetical protein
VFGPRAPSAAPGRAAKQLARLDPDWQLIVRNRGSDLHKNASKTAPDQVKFSG